MVMIFPPMIAMVTVIKRAVHAKNSLEISKCSFFSEWIHFSGSIFFNGFAHP